MLFDDRVRMSDESSAQVGGQDEFDGSTCDRENQQEGSHNRGLVDNKPETEQRPCDPDPGVC